MSYKQFYIFKENEKKKIKLEKFKRIYKENK